MINKFHYGTNWLYGDTIVSLSGHSIMASQVREGNCNDQGHGYYVQHQIVSKYVRYVESQMGYGRCTQYGRGRG